MNLKNSIEHDVKEAMRAKDKRKTAVLRLIMSAIKQFEVDERRELDDDDVTSILDRMIKQRRDSIQQYTKGNRTDLAEKEHVEIEVIRTYLPEQLGGEELVTAVDQAIADAGAESMKDMGRVMFKLKDRLKGRADMTKVSSMVKSKLS